MINVRSACATEAGWGVALDASVCRAESVISPHYFWLPPHRGEGWGGGAMVDGLQVPRRMMLPIGFTFVRIDKDHERDGRRSEWRS